MNSKVHYEEVIIFKGFNEKTQTIITETYKEPWQIIQLYDNYFLAKNTKGKIKAFQK